MGREEKTAVTWQVLSASSNGNASSTCTTGREGAVRAKTVHEGGGEARRACASSPRGFARAIILSLAVRGVYPALHLPPLR